MARARVSLRLPLSLKLAEEKCAEREGVSLIQVVALAIEERVGAARTDFFAERGKGADVARAVVWLEGRAG